MTLEPADIAPETPRPLSRREYDRLAELGAFEDERVELLHGVIVRMSPQSPRHANVIQRLTMLLTSSLSGRAVVSVQAPLAAADDSEPEPDLAVLRDYSDWDEHPATAALVIEVAYASLHKDRRVKAGIYASAGVDEYWIVNLPDRIVEVHTGIVGDDYRTVTRYRHGESIALTAYPDVTLAVDDFVPAE